MIEQSGLEYECYKTQRELQMKIAVGFFKKEVNKDWYPKVEYQFN